jgi:hypothetical protein
LCQAPSERSQALGTSASTSFDPLSAVLYD